MTEYNRDQWDTINEMVELCEKYADEEFDGNESFTTVTSWQDGDFRIEVRHGKGHGKEPYCHNVESVEYRHHDGKVIYADFTRYLDHRYNEFHASKILEVIKQ